MKGAARRRIRKDNTMNGVDTTFTEATVKKIPLRQILELELKSIKIKICRVNYT
jgi:hypothetical protein